MCACIHVEIDALETSDKLDAAVLSPLPPPLSDNRILFFLLFLSKTTMQNVASGKI